MLFHRFPNSLTRTSRTPPIRASAPTSQARRAALIGSPVVALLSRRQVGVQFLHRVSQATSRATSGLPGFFNVKDYGALGDGSTDDTTAIQAAITAAKTYGTLGGMAIGSPTTSACVYFPAGRYCVGTINATGCNGLRLWGLQGTVALYADKQVSTSKPIVDFTGSSYCTSEGLIACGQTPAGAAPSIVPSVGWLWAETTGGGDSNKNRMDDCATFGHFTVASVYLFGSTDNAFYSCAFQQDNDAVCLFVGNSNPYSVSSPNVTIATSPSDTGDNTFYSCEFHGYRNSASTKATSHIYSANNVRFYGGNHDNSGPYHVLFEGTSKQILFSAVKFYSESGHASNDIFYSNNASVLRLGIENIHTEDNAFDTYLVNGTGSPDYTGGWIRGVRAAALLGPYLYFFAEPFPALGGAAVNLAGNTTKYLTIGGFDTNQANAKFPIVRAGVVVGMRCATGGSPSSGQSYVFTLYKNNSSTAITATISGTGTSASDLTHIVSVAAGDTISVEADPSTTASNTGSCWAALGFIPA